MRPQASFLLSRRRLGVCAALCVLAIGLGAGSSARAESAFGPGETMRFTCKFLGITAGKVSVNVGATTKREGADVWPIVVNAQTDSLFALYPLKSRVVTWWEPAVRRTMGSDLQTVERGESKRDRIRYMRSSAKATTTRDREEKPTRSKTYDTPSDAQDVLAVIYALRNEPLAIGDTKRYAVFTGSSNWDLQVKVLRKERVATPGKTCDALALSVELGFDGGLASKRETLIWLSDDASHIPLKFDAEFAFGRLTAELDSYLPGFVPTMPAPGALIATPGGEQP